MLPQLSPIYAKAVLLSAFIFSLAPAARAQGDANSRALAVQLFDEAESLFAKNRVADACPKYAESYRLDPQLGVLVYLAECYEKNGQLASAWGAFREAEEIARKRGDARGEHARERASALEQRLSYIVIDVPESARLPGLQVLRDGAPIAEVLWGARAAIDTGKHRIEVSAAGYKPWRKDVVIAPEPGSQTVEVPKLQVDASAAPGTAAKPVDPNPGTSQRIAALAVGGLGIVGLSAGGFFGLSAQASLSDSKNLCNDKNFCTAAGDELRSSAKSKALIATISTGVGAAALVTATILWFTAPKSEVSASRVGAWSVAPTRSAWGLEMTRDF
jgi:hypothetical protein